MTRWRLIVAMLRRPDRVSRRLVRLLSRWPAESRWHRILDDRRHATPTYSDKPGATDRRESPRPAGEVLIGTRE